MTKFIVLFLTVLFELTKTDTLCPRNEEFRENGSVCEPTCQNKEPQICTLQAVSKCFCKKGYVRAYSNGPCIPVESCDECKENEEFSWCVSCPRYCNETFNPICPAYCRSGCDCKPDYIRRSPSDARCIPEASCCTQREVFKECGSACPGTCSQPSPICTQQCVKGCFCKDGYILNDDRTECIKIKKCRKSTAQ